MILKQASKIVRTCQTVLKFHQCPHFAGEMYIQALSIWHELEESVASLGQMWSTRCGSSPASVPLLCRKLCSSDVNNCSDDGGMSSKHFWIRMSHNIETIFVFISILVFGVKGKTSMANSFIVV